MELSEGMKAELAQFEQILEDGLCKMCSSAGLMDSTITLSPDIDQQWDKYIKDYVADAVENYNSFPEAAIGFAAFLGMAVAFNWDKDWDRYKNREYSYYYGIHGFDDMDDHILDDILKLKADQSKRVSDSIKNCAIAAINLMRHQGIQTDTAFGFFALTRCYCVMYRLGAAIELKRLGYKKVPLN